MALKDFAFKVLSKDKFARCGLIETHRGTLIHLLFMPVGTQATVKACTIDDIKKTGSEIILSNTYHLMIRPGVERVQSTGGLHNFMNCDLPILTDQEDFK
jgi:queuine tRNA-ribosyltransferase